MMNTVTGPLNSGCEKRRGQVDLAISELKEKVIYLRDRVTGFEEILKPLIRYDVPSREGPTCDASDKVDFARDIDEIADTVDYILSRVEHMIEHHQL